MTTIRFKILTEQRCLKHLKSGLNSGSELEPNQLDDELIWDLQNQLCQATFTSCPHDIIRMINVPSILPFSIQFIIVHVNWRAKNDVGLRTGYVLQWFDFFISPMVALQLLQANTSPISIIIMCSQTCKIRIRMMIKKYRLDMILIPSISCQCDFFPACHDDIFERLWLK